jgi:catechol 2,3-dioxygenase-like lactoylglutathione lyase family enzyme
VPAPLGTGEILGLHHVKVPVTDLPRSRAWYERVFELSNRSWSSRAVTAWSAGSLTDPRTVLVLAPRENPDVARGTAGLHPFAILRQGEPDVQACADRLDTLGVEQLPVIEAISGWILNFH